MDQSVRWILAVTGASGIRYGLRLLEVLAEKLPETHVVFSDAALRVLSEEEGIKLSHSNLSVAALLGRELGSVRFHNPRDIGAEIASGSAPFAGMAIVPCSMGSLGAIAAGCGTSLVHRAADVTLKERRRLIVVPRETPLSQIHLENMLTLSRAGAVVMPAMPGFYHQPKSVEDIIDMMVMRILDQMGISNDLVQRWGRSAVM